MDFLKRIRKMFLKEKQIHNARSFCELIRTDEMDEALKIKARLEKYKIPVYMLDQRNASRKSGNEKIIIRIPEKYMAQAKEILNLK